MWGLGARNSSLTTKESKAGHDPASLLVGFAGHKARLRRDTKIGSPSSAGQVSIGMERVEAIITYCVSVSSSYLRVHAPTGMYHDEAIITYCVPVSSVPVSSVSS
jgi:hypothetical protein